MNEAPDIQLVCFDIGGVLVRLARSWEEACATAAVPLPTRLDDPHAFAAMMAANTEHETGRMDMAGFCRAAGDALGMLPRHVQAISDVWLCGPYPGMTEVVDDLHARGLRTACLSNTNARHWQIVTTCPQRGWPAIKRLTYHFTSHEVGHMKPAAEIYRHVEQAAGLPAQAILFFDDAPPNVLAARNRGWQARQVDPAGDVAEQVRGHLRSLGLA